MKMKMIRNMVVGLFGVLGLYTFCNSFGTWTGGNVVLTVMA